MVQLQPHLRVYSRSQLHDLKFPERTLPPQLSGQGGQPIKTLQFIMNSRTWVATTSTSSPFRLRPCDAPAQSRMPPGRRPRCPCAARQRDGALLPLPPLPPVDLSTQSSRSRGAGTASTPPARRCSTPLALAFGLAAAFITA